MVRQNMIRVNMLDTIRYFFGTCLEDAVDVRVPLVLARLARGRRWRRGAPRSRQRRRVPIAHQLVYRVCDL